MTSIELDRIHLLLKVVLAVTGIGLVFSAFALTKDMPIPLYRCGNEYTNSIPESAALKANCRVIIDRYGNAPPIVTSNGDLKIRRGKNGHFNVTGTVNGKPVNFLVDTGATGVAVSEEFARTANLTGGDAVMVKTANGITLQRLIRNVPIDVGPLSVSGVDVVVGLTGGEKNEALLGQRFLSNFEMNISGNELILRKSKLP